MNRATWAGLGAAMMVLVCTAGCRLALPRAGPTPLAFTGLNRPSDFDTDQDGSPEIVRILPIAGLGQRQPRAGRATILLLVEERLWQQPADPRQGDSVRPAIEQYVADIQANGYDVLAARASLYRGPMHKDGRIVLALRRYFAAVRQRADGLRAVALIGDFPDACIVRQFFWKKHGDVTLNEKKPNEAKLKDVHYWACVPEPVADRADIVLADLDGHWDRIYRQGSERIPYFIAAFAKGTGDQAGGTTNTYELGELVFEDFFYVNDGRWQSAPMTDGLKFVYCGPRNEECTEADLRQLNPIARPEIYIARINTRHVGVELRTDVVGANGERLLDEAGRPQAVGFADEKDMPHVRGLWVRSEMAERRLLNEFFRRDHRYRAGEFQAARKPACLATEWGSSLPELRQALPEWKHFNEPGYELTGDKVDLLECVRWLKRPALLRTLKAHSDPWGATVAKTGDLAALQRELGGTVWEWYKDGNRLVPGLQGEHSKLDLPEFQPLYRNGVLPDCAVMYFHTGCEALSPEAARSKPYSDPLYANWQHAEGMLYYLNGLVMIARAKTFNDEPRDFFKLLPEGKTWGEAWMHYFEVEAADPPPYTDEEGIRCKKAYFWSTLGDATLTMFPRATADNRERRP